VQQAAARALHGVPDFEGEPEREEAGPYLRITPINLSAPERDG